PLPMLSNTCEQFGAMLGTFVNDLDHTDPTTLWHCLRLDDAVEYRAQLDLRVLHDQLLHFAQMVEERLTFDQYAVLQHLLGHGQWSDDAARIRTFALGYQRERQRQSRRAVPWAWTEYAHLPPAVRELVLADALRQGVSVLEP
ncbi:MAG TPA: hypothetical protein VHL57_03020, partial [Flavobacteriales bacterium]|nr:hypothetical protein [Flavobacteriales bacterium]